MGVLDGCFLGKSNQGAHARTHARTHTHTLKHIQQKSTGTWTRQTQPEKHTDARGGNTTTTVQFETKGAVMVARAKRGPILHFHTWGVSFFTAPWVNSARIGTHTDTQMLRMQEGLIKKRFILFQAAFYCDYSHQLDLVLPFHAPPPSLHASHPWPIGSCILVFILSWRLGVSYLPFSVVHYLKLRSPISYFPARAQSATAMAGTTRETQTKRDFSGGKI